MKKYLMLLFAITLLVMTYSAEGSALEANWNHGLYIGFTLPGGAVPSGASNEARPNGMIDRTDNIHCDWIQDGMHFAAFMTAVSPEYERSDTFFPGDDPIGGYNFTYGEGYFITALNSFFTSPVRGRNMEVQANDTLHLRFMYQDGGDVYVWGLDTSWASNPSGSGSVFFMVEMIPIEEYDGPEWECFPPHGVKEPEISASTPREFHLAQNSPNPFNASTSIRYSVPEDGVVTLEVFDIEGRKITSLVNQYQSAGHYEVKWDGTNASGKEVSSGSYFYKLTSGDFETQQRMIFLK